MYSGYTSIYWRYFAFRAPDYRLLLPYLCAHRGALSQQGCVSQKINNSISPGTKFCAEFKPSPWMAQTCLLSADINLCSWGNPGKTPHSSALNSRNLQNTRGSRKLMPRGESQVQNHPPWKSVQGTDSGFSVTSHQRCGVSTQEENKTTHGGITP